MGVKVVTKCPFMVTNSNLRLHKRQIFCKMINFRCFRRAIVLANVQTGPNDPNVWPANPRAFVSGTIRAASASVPSNPFKFATKEKFLTSGSAAGQNKQGILKGEVSLYR